MTQTYVIIGLLAAVGVGAWLFRGKLAALGAKVQEEQEARLQAEVEARTRKEWNEIDSKTQEFLDKSRNDAGRGSRLRGLLSNRSSADAETPDADVPET